MYPICKRNNHVYIGKFSNNNPDGQNFHILAILILKYPPYPELSKQILCYEQALHGSRGSGTVIKQTLFAPCTKFLQKEREKQLTSM